MQCKQCNKTFTRKKSDISRGRTKFCSMACSNTYRKEMAVEYASKILKVGRKQCKLCSRTRKLQYFPKSKASYTGYYSYCYECKREINRQQDIKRYDKRKEYSKVAYIKRTYNISYEDYQEMFRLHNGCCAICNSSGKLAIDHCHKTGKIRGLLCHNCNRGLGMFADDKLRLKKAINYL